MSAVGVTRGPCQTRTPQDTCRPMPPVMHVSMLPTAKVPFWRCALQGRPAAAIWLSLRGAASPPYMLLSCMLGHVKHLMSEGLDLHSRGSLMQGKSQKHEPWGFSTIYVAPIESTISSLIYHERVDLTVLACTQLCLSRHVCIRRHVSLRTLRSICECEQ